MVYTWKNLVGEPNLCGGGHLASIVFCCDPRRKKCPFRDYALARLGISKEMFVEIKEKHRVESDTCFGNLAYCCSPEKNCPRRNKALYSLKWNFRQYLQYKWEILKDLVPREMMDRAFTERVLRQYGMELLELDTQKVYRALGFGNIDMKAVWITEVVKSENLANEDLGKELKESEFIGVRMPKVMLRELDELVELGVFESRSQAIRAAVSLLLKTCVKQKSGVKQEA